MTALPPSPNTRGKRHSSGAVNFSQSWQPWLLLLLLTLVAAAYLRFAHLQHSEIGPDQSILYLIAMRFVNGGPLPLAANKSSAGIMNPPLIEYLLALPLLLRTTVTSPIFFQAALSWISVALLAWGSQRLFGWRVAGLAALLFAVNPWAVHYSRFIWNPNPIPFFATALLLALLAMLRPIRPPEGSQRSADSDRSTRQRRDARRGWWLTLALPCLAAITQLHLSGLALLPTVGLILLLTWRRWSSGSWREWLGPLLVGTLLAFLLYLPFIRFEQSVDFGDVQAVVNALVGGRSAITGTVPPAETNAASLALALELVSGAAVWGTQSTWPAALPPGFALTTLARWLFIASLLWAALVTVNSMWSRQPLSPPRLAQGVLLLWVLLPVLFYLRHTVYLQNYYFLYIFPAPFLLIALCLDDAWQTLTQGLTASALPAWTRQAVAVGGITLVLLVAAWQFLIYHTGLRLLNAGQIAPPQPAGAVAETIRITADLLAQYPACDLAILAAGGSVESSPLGLVEAFVYPRQVRLLQTGRGFIMPANCTLYLMSDQDPLAQAWLDAQAQPLRPPSTTLDANWRFYYVANTPPDTAPPLAVWQNGLELVNAVLVGAPAPNSQLILNLTWRVTQMPPPDTRYHFFNHFLDANGTLLAQDDAPAVQTQYWRRGDQLVTQFHLQLPPELPPGPYEIRTGLYTWPDLAQVLLVGGAGAAYTVAVITAETK